MKKQQEKMMAKRVIAGLGFVMFGVRVVWPAVRQSRWFMALPRPSEVVASISAGIQRRVALTRLWINRRIGGGA